jgi:hypothetical protein
MIQLFHATSVFSRLCKDGVAFSDVVVKWFRTGQSTPPRPYEDLIENYTGLDRIRRFYTEHFIDELLTASEVDQLRRYLRQAGGPDFETADEVDPLTVHPISLPVSDAVTGYADLPRGGLADYYLLANQPGYTLPFDIYGYFDLSTNVHEQDMDASVAYLHRALQCLGVDAGVSRQRIEQVAQKLYHRDRLFVTQEKTFSGWLDKVAV